ncbi:hypothetical protein C5746_04795 [Streptomyces atratus]|uniref:Uncharacterized protein n=1 Tax=Streptomyces atratus TaxID=1893 RepID=A0A2Z5J909_STRAR|nr:hypothetical protein C5746_04795 [Streptomyces atratus]
MADVKGQDTSNRRHPPLVTQRILSASLTPTPACSPACARTQSGFGQRAVAAAVASAGRADFEGRAT